MITVRHGLHTKENRRNRNESIYIKSCSNCKYRKKTALQPPCSAGVFQMRYGNQKYCSYWKLHWKEKLKRFWDKFTDDQEFIRLKMGIAMILIIVGMALDGR